MGDIERRMKMDDLKTKLQTEIDNISIEYGQIPNGLIEGWNGIVFYFLTRDAYNTERHELIVGNVIDRLVSQSEYSYTRWVKTKIEAVEWTEYCQITLVSFRVRDSY